VEVIATLLRKDEPTTLLLTGAALREPGLAKAKAIAGVSGCNLIAEFTNGRFQRGRGHAQVARMPWGLDHARAALAETRHLVLVGARDPVAFFAFPGKPRKLLPDGCDLHVLAKPDEDVVEALATLADALGATPKPEPDAGPRPDVPTGGRPPPNPWRA
jgi:acetolactate synthase-1/2/3 large subunit